MDVFALGAVSAAVATAASAAAGGAGRDLWDGLRDLVLRSFRKRSEGETALAAVASSPDDGQVIQAVAQALVDTARRDALVAEGLEAWLARAGTPENDQESVHNTVTGHARIRGSVIQGRDFSGPVNIGRTPPR